ncbi:hypothetical protein CsmBV24.4 [Diolcogaster facetosa bracovirus]|uniref:Uncharacterized protein n=2 Tax=Bracoviriform TaxID=2946836 RepID=R9XLC8_9VIRU|nr:hypothetical protein CsmBV24.4 [Diolcogaster facetosa bracovirus] [Bracoviriform facetosae]AGO14363.1 hypothetical protein CsmBV24.4 [Diolcogaster facetosa bracovirus] [Bracoviriform facetosae]AGO14437.1 hypothetical protein CsmBV24.4 [Cotesia sesamiae Mombasa bracovirus]
MDFATLKKLIVVEFNSGTENSEFIYVPRTWITSYSGRNVAVLLPQGEESLLELDPVVFNTLPSCSWPQFEGTMICETDSVEEAQQIINLKNNGVKDANEIMSSCVAVVTSVIKDIGDQLQKGNQNGLVTPSGVTNRLSAITMLEIIQPVVNNLDRYITDVVRINRSCPVINEKLETTNRTNLENILRLKTFSNNYSEFFRSVMDRHINIITANMKSASPSADDAMTQNVKILNELMSTFIVVLCVMNGNIN